MAFDQRLIKVFAKFFFARYGKSLRSEMHKWEAQAEDDRIIQLIKRLGSYGNDVIMRQGIHIIAPEQVHLGNHIAIGYNTILRGSGGIQIADYCLLGDNVILATDGHPLGEVYFNNPIHQPIHLEPNVWVAAGAIIVGGVTIGENSVIGAGAIVLKDVPPNSVAVGVPAKVIKTLTLDSLLLMRQKEAIHASRGNQTTLPRFEE